MGPLSILDRVVALLPVLLFVGAALIHAAVEERRERVDLRSLRRCERARRASPGSGHQGSAAPAGRAPQLRKEAGRS